MQGILRDSEISSLCEASPPLLSGFLSFEKQLQPAGFDLTIAGLFLLDGAGMIGSLDGRNDSPKRTVIGHEEGTFTLEKGVYIAVLNEIVSLPPDIGALAFPRSTLLRYGCFTSSGVWDPGFSGKSQCLLEVANPKGLRIQHGAALVQMVFFRLSGPTKGFAFNHLYRDEEGRLRTL